MLWQNMTTCLGVWLCVGACCRAAAHRGKYYGAPGSSPALLDKLGNQVRMFNNGVGLGGTGGGGVCMSKDRG